jgi:uncharacterized membrane protein
MSGDGKQAIGGWQAALERGARWGLRHWLLLANMLVLLYGGIPWLSPLAYAAGYPLIGRLLFLIYTPFCHQIPAQSFFWLGYQVAFCHREAAMYTSLLAGGLLFGALRERLPPAPLWAGGLLILPLALDGGSHLLDDLLQAGLRAGDDAIGTPNFWLRIITGVLFAIAVVITIYPRIDRDLRQASFTGNTTR